MKQLTRNKIQGGTEDLARSNVVSRKINKTEKSKGIMTLLVSQSSIHNLTNTSSPLSEEQKLFFSIIPMCVLLSLYVLFNKLYKTSYETEHDLDRDDVILKAHKLPEYDNDGKLTGKKRLTTVIYQPKSNSTEKEYQDLEKCIIKHRRKEEVSDQPKIEELKHEGFDSQQSYGPYSGPDSAAGAAVIVLQLPKGKQGTQHRNDTGVLEETRGQEYIHEAIKHEGYDLQQSNGNYDELEEYRQKADDILEPKNETDAQHSGLQNDISISTLLENDPQDMLPEFVHEQTNIGKLKMYIVNQHRSEGKVLDQSKIECGKEEDVLEEPDGAAGAVEETKRESQYKQLSRGKKDAQQRKEAGVLDGPRGQETFHEVLKDEGNDLQKSNGIYSELESEEQAIAGSIEEEARGVAPAAPAEKLMMVETTSSADLLSINKMEGYDKLLPTKRMYMNFRRGQRPPALIQETYLISRQKGLALTLMRHESFRLGSFNRKKNADSVTQWSTRLAHYGFYNVDGGGMIRCFCCAREFQNGLQDMPPEEAHEQSCTWKQTNISIRDGHPRFSNEELERYLKDYGCGWSQGISHNEENTDRQKQISENSLDSSCVGLAEISERGEVEEDVCGSDPISSVPRPPLADGLMNSSSADYMFGQHRRSLPDNLNALSGSIVTEESLQSMPASQAFLTSASIRPMSRQTAEVAAAEGVSSAEAEAPLLRFDLSKASYPQYASSYSRSMSYNGAWSRDHPKRPEHLTKAGFFYAGYSDCVRCFFCGLGLKYWKPEDIPEYQHARFRPNCVYNRMYMGQEYVDRVQEDRGGGPTASNYLGRQQPQQGEVGQQDSQRTEADTSRTSASVGTTGNTQVNATVSAGEETSSLIRTLAASAMAKGWSREQVNQALLYITRQLGETYLSSDTLERCLNGDALEGYLDGFTQNRGNVSGDSGIEGSISASAISTSLTTGTDSNSDIDSTSTYDSSQADQGASAQPTIYHKQSSPEETVHARQQLAEVENSLLHQRVLCHVCLANPVACVFMPCGHVVACKPCADAANNCVICGRAIIATANIFLS